MKTIQLWLLLTLFLTSCSSVPSKYANDPNVIHLIVLHTNDMHGHAWPRKRADGKTWGGYATQSAMVNKIREEIKKENGAVLLLSGGDVNTGVPESDLLKAEPDFYAMNQIGYDAMVLGNHEFDQGTDKILNQKKWAKFPILSSNIKFKSVPPKKEPLASRSVVLEKGGVKIGIVGFTTDTLSTLVLPQHTAKLEIENVLTAAKREVKNLKEQNPDLIFALTHIGVTTEQESIKVGTSDNLLAETEPDISLIVGGHSHTLLPNGIKVKNTTIVQAGEKGEYLGRVDLYWDKKNKKIVETQATVIPITADLGEDTSLANDLSKFRTKVGAELDKVVGKTAVLLDGERNKVRYLESNLGNLITDVLRDFTHTDISLYNGGGIRGSIPAGPISLRDIYMVFPFKNTIQTSTITGAQIKSLLQQGLDNLETIGSFFHISGGSYLSDGKTIKNIKVAGKPLDPLKTYTFSTNSFVMAGGDFFSALLEVKNIRDTGVTVDQALIEYLHKNPTISPKIEGRIKLEK